MTRLKGNQLLAWATMLIAAMALSGASNASAGTLRISGTGGAVETVRQLGIAFTKANPGLEVEMLPSMGSSGAIKAVLAGRLDIGLCGRPINEDERAKGAVDNRYARTPFVFGVNRTVKKSGMTLAFVVEIYSGKRRKWEDGKRIRLVLRPPSDSDTPVLKRMSPEMKTAVEKALRREGMIVAMTDQEAADAIENIPGAFGATTLALIMSENRSIGVLSLNGVEPSLRSIADGSYPFTKTFCMVTVKNPADKVRRFIEFVRSPRGAEILARNGQAAAR